MKKESSADASGLFSKLKALPLPEEYASKIQKLSASYQMLIALMLNILSLALPIMMLQVYDRIIPHQSYGTLIALVTGVLTALALDATLRSIRAWLVGWSAASHEHNASCAAMDHLTHADITAFSKTGSGEHLQNLTSLGRLREFYSSQAMTALIDLPFATVFLALIAYLGGWLVMVPVSLLLLFMITARFAGARLKNALEGRAHADDEKASFVVSVLTGVHTVKAMAFEAPMMRRFEKMQGDVTKESYRVALASASAANLSAAFGQLSAILTAAIGVFFVIHGYLSIGGLSACTLLAGRAIQPVQRVLGTWLRQQELTIARAQAETLFSLPLQEHERTMPEGSAEGRIIIDDVTFGYDGQPSLLDKVVLTVEPGEVIALKGGKGSGKSTLLQMIAGVLRPVSGTVRVDGFDPSRYDLSNLSGRIGYLPQQGAIFRGTILENMTGFRKDEESIRRARETGVDLGLDVVVDLLPRGYHTLLSDTVADPIPPGVKQRIALVRALMHNPSVILFDDADRALDKEGYNRLFRLMGKLKGRCTLIMASQDQNLLSFADRSFEIGDGGLVALEDGDDSLRFGHLNIRKDGR